MAIVHDPGYCNTCQMWLKNRTQWVEHLPLKKHRKNKARQRLRMLGVKDLTLKGKKYMTLNDLPVHIEEEDDPWQGRHDPPMSRL